MTVWAPALGRTFADIETMFGAPFFPVPYDRLPSRPAIKIAGGWRDGHQRILRRRPAAQPSWRRFRVSDRRRGRDFVYATDHEFGDPDDSTRPSRRFATGASAVILDAHFTPDELPAKGWGHGDWSQCAQFASACGAGNLWLFHHKPGLYGRSTQSDRSRGAPAVRVDGRGG